MSGGLGFTGQSQRANKNNIKMLRKKAPFERMEYNPFINPPKPSSEKPSPKLLQSLIDLKQELATKNVGGGHILTVAIFVLLIFYFLFTFQ